MIDQTLQDLINFIKGAAPVLWEVLLRQVYAEIATNFIWIIVLAILAIYLLRLGKKRWNNDDLDFVSFFAYIFGFISLIVIPLLLTYTIRMLINPYYYAITNALFALKGN